MSVAPPPLSKAQLWILILLVISAWINYMDRGNLGVAAPTIQKELGLGDRQIGTLLAAFFWTYALLQPIAGRVVDRVNVGRLYGFAYLIWSIATFLTGLVNGFGQLFGVRLLLGTGESVAYPCYSRILATTFPESRRGLANALIDVGTKFGPALGTILCAFLISEYGWRVMFVAIGLVSLVWLIPWFQFTSRSEGFAASQQPSPPVGQLLKRKEAWATFLGLFCQNYAWYFLVTWLPSYLVRERHYSTMAMGVYAALPFCATAISSLIAASISDRRVTTRPAVPVRCGFLMTGLFGCGVLLPMALVPNPVLSMVFLVLAFASLGIYTSNAWALTQSMAGPSLAGEWTGWQNGVGNMAGVLAPWLTGVLVARTGNFAMAFYAASGFLFLGVLIYWIGLRDARRRAVQGYAPSRAF